MLVAIFEETLLGKFGTDPLGSHNVDSFDKKLSRASNFCHEANAILQWPFVAFQGPYL